MNRNTLLVALCGFFALGLLGGCSGARPLVDDPTISLNYLKEPSEENLTTLSKAYAQALNRNRKEQVKQPGLAAEYAITLALLGDQQGANQWFNREVADFPSSHAYVVKLKNIYCPAYADDRTAASTPAPDASQADDSEAHDAIQQVIEEQKAAQAGKPAPHKGKKKPAKKPKKH